MSIQALNWAFDQKLPMTQKFVLVALANYADEKNSCFPGQKTLAEQVGASDRTVRRAIEDLEGMGYVARQRRSREGGYRTSDRYVLSVGKPTGHPDRLEPSGQNDHRSDSPSQPDNVSILTGQSVLAEPPVIPQVSTKSVPGKPDTRTPEHRAADDAYNKTGKALNFMATRQIAKWAIHERQKTEAQVSQAIVATYEAGKPITKSTIGQYLDGITKGSPRPEGKPAVPAAYGWFNQ